MGLNRSRQKNYSRCSLESIIRSALYCLSFNIRHRLRLHSMKRHSLIFHLSQILILKIYLTSIRGDIAEPIEYLDGDYIVAGIFTIGKFTETGADNKTYPDGYCRSYTNDSFWSVQRGLAFKRTVLEERRRLR